MHRLRSGRNFIYKPRISCFYGNRHTFWFEKQDVQLTELEISCLKVMTFALSSLHLILGYTEEEVEKMKMMSHKRINPSIDITIAARKNDMRIFEVNIILHVSVEGITINQF